MKKALFIDRDGTIIVEPPDEQIDSYEKLAFLPGAIGALARIAKAGIYELVMVTNQDGLGTASFPEDTFWPAHQKMLDILAAEGILFDAIHIDRSFPHENLPTRKPGTAMLTAYMDGSYDLANSFVIGDRLTDVQLAENLGCQSVLIGKTDERAALCTSDWHQIADFLLAANGRSATVHRKTNETDIRVTLRMDGKGRSEMATGLGFFDHMLDQLARHSGCSLEVQVIGDLHIDEHHTIEDTALALGEAFARALGNKKGIERYGFAILPMDDALAQVSIDFSGRPWLVWNGKFHREKVGQMPTEMVYHFFKSFSDTAKCNLNMQFSGDNDHHQIEILFKAFARAIRSAIALRPGDTSIPSTKGIL
ncbi:bifunctional histidinol-phosphatase/imidazoleglycerol-phosphate dehydratase HisB [Rhodoflexus caldus]|uniref:bifunctional histidinol-phosphatase/imidazoleglycerol-phosphate dehydratase HisB n=1 Tax=Rhodoflexus caldus TaxID=2891236 RepID=UPI00202AA799|nr:bifunctional histidinol-phosphatase/imidazoleglycerol-phosphate dehydratase HisB [Rhodoflexus caldus]